MPAARRRRAWPRRLLITLGVLLFLGLLGAIGVRIFVHEPRPEGRPGPEADALARRIQAAVGLPGWAQVGAVRWRFGSRDHLWDRARNRVRVRWGERRAYLDLGTRGGRAFEGATELEGAARDGLLQEAWSGWINDAFWLYPFAGFFDAGVTRGLVDREGDPRPGLLVTYASGGVTPGDAYLWLVGPDDRPVAWQMWVKILPAGGVKATWADWIELPGGAQVATRHAIGPITLRLHDVASAADAETLEPGAFAPLEGR